MKLIIDTKEIESNISKASKLVNVPISLMFKDFYEDIKSHLTIPQDTTIFGLHIPKSVCYSINKACSENSGALIVSEEDYQRCYYLGIDKFYIPINANDNREGLSPIDARELSKRIDRSCRVYGIVTSGCINDRFPSFSDLSSLYDTLKYHIHKISLGGSFYLSKCYLPNFVSDVRIGEYMLFGTIPYDDCDYRRGRCGITIDAKVIEVFKERNQILIDCGYSIANMDKCKFLYPYKGLSYVDSSSEYSIFDSDDVDNISIGDTISFIPDYKSLVKLRYAPVKYTR